MNKPYPGDPVWPDTVQWHHAPWQAEHTRNCSGCGGHGFRTWVTEVGSRRIPCVFCQPEQPRDTKREG